ncbi:alpha-1,2-fucosyltransferase [Plebeiibacterium sediminum]|uniref:Alpha-1,2-fucosyltransferase n=1 Tax=Plebeiibacterium sediminum TaxID=2992112 RepID=A0AAE3SF78_9BACT|nr:alpha-1,2-fucosyltransferase [Plebeiobacterium sediminum]MCW3786767.1 alpha-1,2-fucosyltransferase [Plebeiobacterium sediminum]
MLVVKYIGGLGNQLFQLAFVLELRERGYKVFEDITDYRYYDRHQGFEVDKVFDIQIKHVDVKNLSRLRSDYPSVINKIKSKLLGGVKLKSTHIFQNNFDFSKIENQKDYYLEGYWQNCNTYLIKDNLRSFIKFKSFSLSTKNKNVLECINSSNSVGVHIRRGDYLNKENISHFEQVGVEYYLKAKEIIQSKLKDNVQFFFFSDDIDFVKSNYDWGCNVKYIDWNVGDKSYLDMYLMANCKGLIIPNSTFSWWAGILGKDKKHVVAPKYWWQDREKDNDIYLPNKWNLVDNRLNL